MLRTHEADPGPPDVRAQADWLMWVRHVAYRVASDKATEEELHDPPWLNLCEASTQGWWRWTKSLYYTGIDEIDQHKLTELDVEAQDLTREADSLDQTSWTAWLEESSKAGAGPAHAITRDPVHWQLSTLDPEGVPTADPGLVFQHEGEKWAKLWLAEPGVLQEAEAPWLGKIKAAARHQPLRKLTPTEIRAVSYTFPVRTSQQVDGFHPRHFAYLTDEALRYISELFYLWEKFWIWPTALSFMVVTLLPRPDGGWRPIAFFYSTLSAMGKMS